MGANYCGDKIFIDIIGTSYHEKLPNFNYIAK